MSKSFELIPELNGSVNRFLFGVIVGNEIFVDHFRSDSKFEEFEIIDSKCVFENYRKRLLIQFKTFSERTIQSIGSTDESSDSGSDLELISNPEPLTEWMENKFEFAVNYSQIKSIEFKENKLFIRLLYPPILYTICREEDIEDEEYLNPYMCDWNDYQLEPTLNANGFDSGYEELMSELKNIEDFDEDFNYLVDDSCANQSVNHFNGFRLRTTKLFDINEEKFTKINSICMEFEDKTLLSDIISNIKAFDPLIPMQEKCYELRDNKRESIDSCLVFGLPFGVEYSLHALTNHSFYLFDSLDYNNNSFEEFVDLVKELTKMSEKTVEYSLNELQKKLENYLDLNPIEDLKHSFNRFKDQTYKKWTNSSVVLVRRCILTPTRLLLLPALPLQQSRFFRISNPEYVVRILIKDEDFQLLSFTTGKTSLPDRHPFVERMKTFLKNTIQKRLRTGIRIGGRTYELVGASTSQLRDHGLVLYARDDQHRDVEQICRQIGELKSIRNAAKFIARIGLSMSQSMGFVANVDCIRVIDDIFGGYNEKSGKPFCFSDGVGQISRDMALELCTALRIKSVSTFQIRFGGCKGVLVINPELEGKQILIRDSMKKFESNSTELDVLKVSEPRTCYLNRPLIAILNRMGVTNEELMKLLFDRLKQLSNAYSCNCKAIELMNDYSGLKFEFKQLLDSGVDVLSEPFFVAIIESIIRKVGLDLRNKARIQVPIDSARVMFGVLDETRTLEYGQVFVQYSHQESGTNRVLTEEVLVTKYPCMHAGDVRKLMAVDVPALHHIVDCIVFPSVGQRPHPDEMAGSDLDGDEYSVIWYKPLVFDRQNYSPMQFPYSEPEDLGHEVNTDDILSFYCRFIACNQVGLIASSHLVWADSNPMGVMSNICEHLDFKYAIALDYAKTGVNSRLRNEQKPHKYPDFMMKYSEKPTYESHKALGKLYQKNCYFYDIINEFSEQNYMSFKLNPKLIDENANIYMSEAKEMFELYRKAIIDLREQFGIENESELVSAMFTKTHKYLCTQNDNNDIHDLVSNIVKQLFTDLKQKFESGVSDEQRLVKASAWYQVCHQINSEGTEESDKYYGFAWIVSHYLAELALRNGSTKHECNQNGIKSNGQQINTFGITLIKSIINLFLRNFIEITVQSEEYVERNIEKVIQKYDSNRTQFPITILSEIFDTFVDNVNDFENEVEFDVAIVALMANFKLKRLGIERALKNEFILIKSEQNSDSNVSNLVFVSAISDKLSNYIKSNEELFKLIVKQRTGVLQIAIRSGFRTNETHICVYGRRSSTEKFRKFIIRPFLDLELADNCYLKD